jgi:acrylyl-CoA reductase (NADPH)
MEDLDTIAAFVLSNDPTVAPATQGVKRLSRQDLPRQGDTLVRVRYSSLNYKDGLAVTGKGKVIRGRYPFVPGIDLVGDVVETDSRDLQPGASVVGTGWGLGETYWGGYSQMQWVDASWLVELPSSLSPLRAMVAGTAGLTAMLAVLELQSRDRTPNDGPIVVTGATGGVGSLSVLFLSRLGYEVIASTGKTSEHDYLRALGAATIVNRDELGAGASRPLDSAKWSGAVDSVGGTTLEALLSGMTRHGVIASCGLAGGANFSTTVFPFILRGVSLIGIDSNTCPNSKRVEAWEQISLLLDDAIAELVAIVEPLDRIPDICRQITSGRVTGRIVVDVNSVSGEGRND